MESKKEETKKLLEGVIEIKNKFDKGLDILLQVFPNAFESELVESFNQLFDFNCSLVSKLGGIPLDTIEWFVYDNAFGANKFTADGVIIDSLDAFVEFEFKALEDERKQKNGTGKNEE